MKYIVRLFMSVPLESKSFSFVTFASDVATRALNKCNYISLLVLLQSQANIY
jgi:hypothetical protein